MATAAVVTPPLEILPSIGARGLWELKPDLASVAIKSQVSYTCMGLRKISEYTANKEDVYKEVYSKIGLSKERCAEDTKNNICIVSIQGGTGVWFYIPANSIKTFPSIDGVNYNVFLLSCSLGLMEQSFKFDAIIESVKNLIKENLGIEPDVKVVIATDAQTLTKENHQIFVNKRLAAKTNNDSDRAKFIKINDQLIKANAKIAQLEAFIKTKLP